MHVHDVSGDREVILILLLVEDDEEEIETGHDWSRDVYVVAERLGAVVPSSDRVCSSQDRGASVERGVNASLGNGDRLLFHSLVDSHLILDVHLVELINAADAMVSEHKRTSFDTELTSLWVLAHRCSQTSRIGGLTATVDRAGQELADVLEELRFSCGGVSDNTNIDITSQLDSIGCVLFDSAKKLEENSLLHVEVAIDSRCHRPGQLSVEVLLVLHQHNSVLLLLRELIQILFLLLFIS